MSRHKRISDNVKVAVCRWWFAGAVFFFIGFGTTLGQADGLDLMFVISLVMGLGTAFVFNPIIYRVFDIKAGDRVVNAEYFSRPLLRRVAGDLGEVLRAFLIVILIWMTYVAINFVANRMLGNTPDTVVLGVEPFLFATLYLVYFTLTRLAGRVISPLFRHKEV